MVTALKNKLLSLAVLTLALLAGCSPMSARASIKGHMLVDAKGMARYTFDRSVHTAKIQVNKKAGFTGLLTVLSPAGLSA